MWKARAAALGFAVVSVGLLATPASAAQTVTKFRGKDANLVVSNCTPGSSAGTTCTAWNVFASQSRCLLSDGTVSKSPFLGLDKFRVKFTTTGFTFKLVRSYESTSVTLNVADNLSTASGRGVIPKSGDDIDVSFSLVANARAGFDPFEGRAEVRRLQDHRSPELRQPHRWRVGDHRRHDVSDGPAGLRLREHDRHERPDHDHPGDLPAPARPIGLRSSRGVCVCDRSRRRTEARG